MPRADLVKAAQYYSEAGYPIFKLVGKVPEKYSGNWRKTEYLFPGDVPAFLKDWDGNIGVPLGRRDLVIDIDPRNFKDGDRPDQRLFKALGSDVKRLGAIARTGGGGVHIYLRLPEGVQVSKKIKNYAGIDFLSDGCYVVGAGSVHPDSGKPYEWAGGVALNKIGEAPAALIDIIRKKGDDPAGPAARKTANGTHPVLRDDDAETISRYVEWLKTAPIAVQGDNGDATTYTVACKGRDFGLSREKTLELMLLHYNHRCIPDWKPEQLKLKVRNAYSYASSAPGASLPESDFAPVVDPAKHPLFRGWDRFENGQLKKTLNNVFNFFIISDSPVTGTVAYDEFNGQVKILKQLPWHADKLPPGGKEWSDEDSVQLRLWLSRERQFDVPIQVVDQAVLTAAQLKILHPVKDYLRSLRWDGKPRIESFLVDYAGAKDNKFVREASKKFLLQAVSRIYHPGSKADHIIVLEGEQGVGKSSLVEILGGQWYGDIVIDPHSRDTVDAMRGKWFIEFSEMEAHNRADQQAMKAFITRRVDRVRLAYGRRSLDLPRQCVFMGTMNPDATGEYLSDSTGNRRVWPILIQKVHFAEVLAARDQLFAEAADLVLKGEATYIIDREVQEFAIREQRMRQTSDPWGYSIQEWVDKDGLTFVTTKDVWVYAIKGAEAMLTNIHQRRIAACLKELGFVTHVKRDGERTVRGYMDARVRIDKRDDKDLFS